MLNHESLGSYYKNTFTMIQHHKYSLTEIEQMLPFERILYIDMLDEFLDQMKNDMPAE